MSHFKFTITNLSFILSSLIFTMTFQATIQDDYEIPDVKEFQYKDLNKYKKYHKIFSPNFIGLVNRLRRDSSANILITIPSDAINTELMGKSLASNTEKDLFYLDFPYMTEKYYAKKEPNRLSNLFTYVPEISDNSILLINNIDKLTSLDYSENYERFVKILYDEIKDKLHKNFAIVAILQNDNTIYPPLKDFDWDQDIQLKKPTYEARKSLIKNILKDKNINCKKEDLDQFAKKTNNLYQEEIQEIIYNAIDEINTSNSNSIKSSCPQSLYTSSCNNPSIANTTKSWLYSYQKAINLVNNPNDLVLTTQNFYDSLYDSPFYNPNIKNKSKLILYLFEKNKAKIEERSSFALAKELVDFNAQDINELIEKSKFESSSNKLKLSNLLKYHYNNNIHLRNQNIDKSLRYPLLKGFAKKNNIVISNEELKELVNNIDTLTPENIHQKKSINELLVAQNNSLQKEILIDATLNKKTNSFISQIIKPTKKLNDLVGSLDIELIHWINNLECAIKFQTTTSELSSNLILYGVPGNGKTTLAEAIAAELERDFIKISVTDLSDEYQLSISKIKELFAAAREHTKPVLILIDEISFISRENEIVEFINQTKEEEKTDINKGKIIIIGTTNNYDDLGNSFKSTRFTGIEIKNPDKNTRQDLINFFIKNTNHVDSTTQYYKNKLAKKTNKWSVSNIESMIGLACDSKYQQLYDLIESKEINRFTDINIEDEDIKTGYEKMLEQINRSKKPWNIRLNQTIGNNQDIINSFISILGLYLASIISE